MPQLQAATASLSLNGITCPFLLELEVSQSNYMEAGQLRASILLRQDPESQAVGDLVSGAGAPGSAIAFMAELGGTSDLNQPALMQPIMSGTVDMLGFDPSRGILEVVGRDYLAGLAYIPPPSTFVNQTSSQVVETLAASSGLDVSAVATSTIIGQYYEIEHSRGCLNTFSRFANALDLVVFLARLEQYDCWVSGQTLNFQPRTATSTLPFILDLSLLGPKSQYSTSLTSLRFDKRVSPDARSAVSVRSWNSRQRTVVESSYPSGSDGTSTVFIVPNLTGDAALMRAQSIYADLSRHRQVVSGSMAGDLSLFPRSVMRVQGSNGWDGDYVVDEVTREINPHGGFTQSFVARAL